MNEIVCELAIGLVSKTEKLIRSAVDFKIGHSDWLITDLKNRGERITLPDGTEIFAFDGQELIHFGLFRTNIDTEGRTTKVSLVQEYQLLY